MNNTDPTLTLLDTLSDSEPSLAVKGGGSELASHTFPPGSWASGNAPLWHSTDGGNTWTKRFTMPPPTGVTVSGCPCDVTLDFDRSSRLFGTALNVVGSGANATGDVYTGETTNPASGAAWSWYAPGGVAQKTDLVGSGTHDADQPWLRITRDPVDSTQDNAYVAYDDFTDDTVRVAVAPGSAPPNFTRDASPGFQGPGAVNPGMRVAVDHSDGTVYALWEYGTGTNADGSKAVLYAINRSTDGGSTWSLPQGNVGVVVASANSDQLTPKFGSVNGLRGGVDAIAVDSTSQDVYVVYGSKDPTTGNNRLAIKRLTRNGSGGLGFGPDRFVTGQVQAALPSVAVAANGTVGVLYDTFDGTGAGGYPQFTVHLAQSTDRGSTFSDVPLVTFLSPVLDNGDPKQRILGDYQQLRSLGNNFYGIFPANGAAFGRALANIDPIFVRAPADFPPPFAGGVRVAAGDVNNDGNADIITGAGIGGGPHVKVFSGVDNSLLYSFFAYDPAFTRGIYVGAGDVNNNGYDDIITGAGAGGGPHVKVFSGATGDTLASFFAFSPAFAGGVRVAGGDVNGDGNDDIVAAAGPGGGPHVKVFDGANPANVLKSFFAYDPAFTAGVFVGAGDVNGDGKADIVTGAGAGGGPHVKVFSGADGSTLYSFFAYDPAFTGGVRVAARDVNGDGKADIITAAGAGGGPHVKVFSGANLSLLQSFFAYDPAFTAGVFVGAGDIDADAHADVVTGPDAGGGPHVKAFSGATGSVLRSFFAY